MSPQYVNHSILLTVFFYNIFIKMPSCHTIEKYSKNVYKNINIRYKMA